MFSTTSNGRLPSLSALSAAVRSAWSDFEEWLSSADGPQARVEARRTEELAALESAWAAKFPPALSATPQPAPAPKGKGGKGKKNAPKTAVKPTPAASTPTPTVAERAAHEASKAHLERTLHSALVAHLREAWLSRLAAENLSPEHWVDMTPEELAAVERVLGGEDEDENGTGEGTGDGGGGKGPAMKFDAVDWAGMLAKRHRDAPKVIGEWNDTNDHQVEAPTSTQAQAPAKDKGKAKGKGKKADDDPKSKKVDDVKKEDPKAGKKPIEPKKDESKSSAGRLWGLLGSGPAPKPEATPAPELEPELPISIPPSDPLASAASSLFAALSSNNPSQFSNSSTNPFTGTNPSTYSLSNTSTHSNASQYPSSSAYPSQYPSSFTNPIVASAPGNQTTNALQYAVVNPATFAGDDDDGYGYADDDDETGSPFEDLAFEFLKRDQPPAPVAPSLGSWNNSTVSHPAAQTSRTTASNAGSSQNSYPSSAHTSYPSSAQVSHASSAQTSHTGSPEHAPQAIPGDPLAAAAAWAKTATAPPAPPTRHGLGAMFSGTSGAGINNQFSSASAGSYSSAGNVGTAFSSASDAVYTRSNEVRKRQKSLSGPIVASASAAAQGPTSYVGGLSSASSQGSSITMSGSGSTSASGKVRREARYIGPNLGSGDDDEDDTVSLRHGHNDNSNRGNLSRADEEADFEAWKLDARIMMIHEFHAEAAAADEELVRGINAIRVASKRSTNSSTSTQGHDEARLISDHERKMAVLRKAKDDKRKDLVTAERRRRREAFHLRSAVNATTDTSKKPPSKLPTSGSAAKMTSSASSTPKAPAASGTSARGAGEDWPTDTANDFEGLDPQLVQKMLAAQAAMAQQFDAWSSSKVTASASGPAAPLSGKDIKGKTDDKPATKSTAATSKPSSTTSKLTAPRLASVHSSDSAEAQSSESEGWGTAKMPGGARPAKGTKKKGNKGDAVEEVNPQVKEEKPEVHRQWEDEPRPVWGAPTVKEKGKQKAAEDAEREKYAAKEKLSKTATSSSWQPASKATTKILPPAPVTKSVSMHPSTGKAVPPVTTKPTAAGNAVIPTWKASLFDDETSSASPGATSSRTTLDHMHASKPSLSQTQAFLSTQPVSSASASAARGSAPPQQDFWMPNMLRSASDQAAFSASLKPSDPVVRSASDQPPRAHALHQQPPHRVPAGARGPEIWLPPQPKQQSHAPAPDAALASQGHGPSQQARAKSSVDKSSSASRPTMYNTKPSSSFASANLKGKARKAVVIVEEVSDDEAPGLSHQEHPTSANIILEPASMSDAEEANANALPQRAAEEKLPPGPKHVRWSPGNQGSDSTPDDKGASGFTGGWAEASRAKQKTARAESGDDVTRLPMEALDGLKRGKPASAV